MSYYDHAVMITNKLGPWANAGRDDHREIRQPPRSKPLSALIRWTTRTFRTFRDTRVKLVRVERQPRPDTVECETHHKGLSAG